MLERTVWLAPEQTRGLLAMEAQVRRNGKVLQGERVEPQTYAAQRPLAPQPVAKTQASFN